MPANATDAAERPIQPRRFRFGLRTALMMFLIAGILFGWLGREYSIVQLEQKAIENLTQDAIAGSAYFSHEKVSTFGWPTSHSGDSTPSHEQLPFGDDFFIRVNRL